MKRKYVLIGISVLIVVCIIVIVCTFGCNYSRINGGSPALLINSVNAEPGEKDRGSKAVLQRPYCSHQAAA